MVWEGLKRSRRVQNGLGGSTMVWKDSRWPIGGSKMIWDGPKQSRIVQDGLVESKIVWEGSRRSARVKDGLGGFKMV